MIIIIIDLFFIKMQGRLMDKYFFLYFIAFIKKLDHYEGKNSYRVKIDVY